ncbi:Hypothetical protein, putative [Bodo saltans]|uniref:Suppressor of forked domain-containing protein n=1 Tax=Bodo saltans TaxID=75058 RepID=A0A0S4KDZ3_BODSA|nr:Hypothetical protein, putative [Bodo saltans]|eukprot:CUI11981.1 Hypothetical protein, putative [Bodo saltans]
MQGGFDGYDVAGFSPAVTSGGAAAGGAPLDVHEDDLDMLQMMATLERSTAAPTASAPGANAAQLSVATTAAEALVSLHAAMGATGGAAAARSMKAARPKLSAAAAGTLSNALNRHPALHIFHSLQERVELWTSAVTASMAYETDDAEEDNSDKNDESVASNPPSAGTSALATATTAAARADQSVLNASGTAGVRHAFTYVQQLCDELELERLAAVFRGAESGRDIIASVEKRVDEAIAHLGFFPNHMAGDAAAVPQRCWYHCLFGPLLSPEHADWAPPNAASSVSPSETDAGRSNNKNQAAHLQLGLDTSRLAEVRLPLVSASLAHAVERASRCPYDSSAWLHILETAMDIPMADARSTWQQACFLFPTCGPVVIAYLRAELAALHDLQQSALAVSSAVASGDSNTNSASTFTFQEGLDEETTKHIFRAQLRILNAFYRHLPRCASWELYDMFLTFAQNNVVTDTRTTDQLYRCALEQHVGNCVDSTPLWLRYLEWRAHKTTNITEKQHFVRTMFHRILRTPLYGLQEVRERYDLFESAEVRGGRFRLEDELERSMTRAKSIAADRVDLLKPLLRQRLVATSARRAGGGAFDSNELPTVIPFSSSRVFLPRPFHPNPEQHMKFPRAGSNAATATAGQGITASMLLQNMSGGGGGHSSGAGGDESALQWLHPEEELFEEQEVWQLLHRALASEIDTNYSPANTEEGHFKRVAFALRLRWTMFPHESVCWLEYANILLYGFPRHRPRADFGPTGAVGSAAPAYLGPRSVQLAAEVLEDAIALHPYHMHTTVVVADLCRLRLASPRRGDRWYFMSLEASRSRLLTRLLPTCDAMLLAAQRSAAQHHNSSSGGNKHLSSSLKVDHNLLAFHERYLTLYDHLTTLLEQTVVLAGNWLSYSRAAYPKTAATQTRLVARYLMQDLELLSMVMGALRRMVRLSTVLQCPHLCSPRRFLDAFNAFCSHWVMIELHQLHSPDAALAIVQGWCEQYKSMIASTRQQFWTIGDCGVDERFFARATEVGSSWGKPQMNADGTHQQNIVTASPAAAQGAGGAGKPQSGRRIHAVLSMIDELISAFPHAPPTAAELADPMPSSGVEGLERQRVAQRRVVVYQSTLAPRRWVLSLCQRLDPIGLFVRASFPHLLDRCRSPISGGSPPNAEGSKTLHASWWSTLGLGGVATSGASEMARSCYEPLLPVPMNGVADSSNSAESARRTEALAEAFCLEDTREFGYLPAPRPTDHRLRNEDDDDLDPVYPDAAAWELLPPRPAYVARGGRGGGRGGRGSSFARGGRASGAAHDASTHRLHQHDGDDGADDEHLDTDFPTHRHGDGSSLTNGGGADGGTLLAIGDALMSLSAAMEKRTKQTLGRRISVRATSFQSSSLPREGLLASLDLTACDRRVEELVAEGRNPTKAQDEEAAAGGGGLWLGSHQRLWDAALNHSTILQLEEMHHGVGCLFQAHNVAALSSKQLLSNCSLRRSRPGHAQRQRAQQCVWMRTHVLEAHDIVAKARCRR